MLTCKVGKEEIHSFEYEYEQLKKWSNKKLLKCPQCNDTLIYRHGKIKVPHFAHEHLECSNTYQEQDTLEHMEGKIALYKWVKQIEGVSNVSVEKYIPETKQIADIYFEYNDEKYVIEYQCSPISSEFLERKELYRLNGIKDIWILGFEKYLNNKTTCGYFKTKEIERQLLFSNNQRLCYSNSEGVRIINDYKPLLDRKTTFDFYDYENKSYSELKFDDLLKEPNNNEEQIINWFDDNLKDNVDRVKYKNDIEIRIIEDEKIIKLNPIISFAMDDSKYLIIYNNGYINIDNYKYIKRKLLEESIHVLYFINYEPYKQFLNVQCENRNIANGIHCDWVFINDNKCIIQERKIIKNDYYEIDQEVIWLAYIQNILKNIGLENLYDNDINNKHKDKLFNSAKDNNVSFRYETNNKLNLVEFKDLILSYSRIECKHNISNNNNLIDKWNDELKKTIYDYYDDTISRIKDDYVKYQNCLSGYKVFKEYVKDIFDSNKDIVIKYDMDYVDNDNINLIYFKTHKNTEHIVYHSYLTKSFNGAFEYNFNYNPDCKTIRIHLDDYSNFNFIENAYMNNYDFKKINKCYFNIKYNNKYNKKIRLSYKRYENKYFDVNRFNFAEKIKELDEVIAYKNTLSKDLMDNLELDFNKIYTAEDMTLEIKNKEFDEKIKKCLYPIIYQMENNDLEEYNFRLNYDFCNKEPWVIKDFIEKLRELGFNNITNVI